MTKTCHFKNEFIKHKGDQVKRWEVIKKVDKWTWENQGVAYYAPKRKQIALSLVFHKYWVATSEKFTKNKPPIY